MEHKTVHIIGAGLAGSEAALQLARAGVSVKLYEMRPGLNTPAHKTSLPAELVCSNSLKGTGTTSAHGLLKKELEIYDSALIPLAYEARVAAGESLTVDREKFSMLVDGAIKAEPNIEFLREEVTSLDPKQYTLVATGPLTSETLAKKLSNLLGSQHLAFFDSIAPVVEADSINMEAAYEKNRWEKGESPDFINCPLNKEQYEDFVNALREADTVEAKPFEKGQLFEGCLPLEEMARRGVETLRFGPMRPIGLKHPETGEMPHAVIQLRAENEHKTLYNLVGCQTRLKWGTQKEIFSKVPALANAQYARLGAMHRNTFINSPEKLNSYLNMPGTKLFFAGQITGAEGYTEAIATGFYGAMNILAHLHGDKIDWPEFSCLASLCRHLSFPNPEFQPMNFNFGLLPQLEKAPKKQKKALKSEKCLLEAQKFADFQLKASRDNWKRNTSIKV